MRTAEIELAGRKYPAAFSLRVLGNLEARTGKPAGDALDALLSADTLNVTDTVWLLSQMLAAGAAATGSMQRTPTEEQMMVRAVRVQMMMVSMNTSKMPYRPCCTGPLVSAAA